MRLKTKLLNDIEIHRKTAVKSDYIGTETRYVYISSLKADIQPADNKLSDKIYGENTDNLKNIFMPADTDIKNSDRIKISGEEYEVISVMKYTSHIKAVARMI
jgi:mRNA-degrading endonuclease HigB of HigAB toxin-antitoxin module